MRTTDSFQSSIAPEIIDYISLKKALGYSFSSASIILLNLDQFLYTMGTPSPDLTAETFNLWCRTMETVSPNTKLDRLHTVRNFCLYRRRMSPTCFVPDSTQFPEARPAIQPYIFSDIEVARILSCGDGIPDTVRSPLRSASTRLAILLLYTAGLRRGELLRLTVGDYDASTQTLIVRESKFHKSRILPLQNDVAQQTEKFLKKLQLVRSPLPAHTPLIWSPYCAGRAYSSNRLRKNVNILLTLAGIKKPDGRLPRIHDFRFSFAVNVLLRWYRNGDNVQAKLPLLAAYMGHVSILSTYYYLRFITPLASLASSAFATHYGALIHGAETESMI